MLFVGHSPDAVRSICQKALFLMNGQPAFYGPAERATDLYLSHIREHTNQEALKAQCDLSTPVRLANQVSGQLRYGTGHVQLEKVEVLEKGGAPCRAFKLGDQVAVEATLHSQIDTKDLSVSFLVRDMTGIDVMGTTTFDEKAVAPALKAGQRCTVRFTFENRLRAGNYGICVAVTRVSQKDYSDVVLFDQVDGCAGFVVVPDPERPVHYKFHQPVSVRWGQSGAPGGPANG
jgi:lipopolysaccharide transport system ATP-binding protein